MENNKLRKPLENYIPNAQNSRVWGTKDSKLEIIVKGVKVAIKSTLNYIKKYVIGGTPEFGDGGNPDYKAKYKRRL